MTAFSYQDRDRPFPGRLKTQGDREDRWMVGSTETKTSYNAGRNAAGAPRLPGARGSISIPGRRRLARAARVGTRGALVRYAGGRRPMNIPTIEKIRKSTNNT